MQRHLTNAVEKVGNELNQVNLGFTTSITRHAQYEYLCAPRYITSGCSPLVDAQLRTSKPMPPAPRQMEFHAPPQGLVPANPYLYEEIPYWLEFYIRAAPEHDHKLRWELFQLPELDCYVNVLKTFVQTGTGDD